MKNLMDGTKTKIVATLGPATNSYEIIKDLMINGADVFRLNFSHGTHEEHLNLIKLIRKVSDDYGYQIGILQDLQGPKIRIGKIDGTVTLIENEELIIKKEEVLGNKNEISLTYPQILSELEEGMTLKINDGLIILTVTEIHHWGVKTIVKIGGEISSHKGLNIPEASLELIPALTKKDLEDLKFGMENSVDYVAISFVRSSKDIDLLKWEINKFGYNVDDVPYIIAKIERQQAVDEIDGILDRVEGIMVARGDLGIEVEITKLPTLQRELVNKANIKGKLVITATQMLDSMTHNFTPTRAEVTDVANAVLDGTDAVMLSGETSIGKYPLESVITMNKILEHAEEDIIKNPRSYRSKLLFEERASLDGALSMSVSLISQKLSIKAVVCFTSSGYTPRILSKNRPESPIIAYCLDDRIKRKLSLTWGTLARVIKEPENFDDLIITIKKDLLNNENFEKGDFVIIVTSLPLGARKTTNTLKVHQI